MKHGDPCSCYTCGYTWIAGRDGSHSCSQTLKSEVDRLRASNERKDEALAAVWRYEEAVQRDLKTRGEVSDGTMHLLLRARDLRKAALSESEPGKGGDR